MKILKIRSIVPLLLVLVAIFWTACQKDVSNQSNENQPQTSVNNQARNGGLVADDPARVSQVPMFMSAGLTASTVGQRLADISTSAKGGKPSGGGGGTTDVTPPTVSITSPANGADISSLTSVTIQVSASDNVGVASVSVTAGGTSLGTLTASPYTFTWSTGALANGTYAISATAKDAKGNSSSTSITVSKNVVIVTPPPPTLPANYTLTTPAVGNQGNEFACTPFAAVYGARSMEQYYRTGATAYSNSTNVFSPEYVYDQTKVGDCGSGTSITACLDFMYTYGVTTWTTVPFSDVNGCTLTPTAAQIAEAALYKIPNYSKMQNNDQTMIKTMIYGKHAVIASLNIDNNFTNAVAGYTWNSIGANNAPHCVAVIGYDDNHDNGDGTKGAYRVLNSWGTSWGDAGYLWITYSVFALRAGYYVYAMNY